MISLILCRLGCRFWLHTWLLKFYPSGVFHPFQPTAAFHTESSHLIGSAKQMTGFYMKCNTGLKWVNPKDKTPIQSRQ